MIASRASLLTTGPSTNRGINSYLQYAFAVTNAVCLSHTCAEQATMFAPKRPDKAVAYKVLP